MLTLTQEVTTLEVATEVVMQVCIKGMVLVAVEVLEVAQMLVMVQKTVGQKMELDVRFAWVENPQNLPIHHPREIRSTKKVGGVGTPHLVP